MIYDMSAAPKLARNYEEQKEWNRWDGVGVGRKINKDPKQNKEEEEEKRPSIANK